MKRTLSALLVLLLVLSALSAFAQGDVPPGEGILYFAPAAGRIQREPQWHQPPFAPDADLLHVVFIDMGMNDAILLETDGQFLLVDGGDWGQSGKVLNYLKHRGIGRLDAMFSTHAHDDHLEGQRRLLGEGIQIARHYSPYGPEARLPRYDKMRKLLDKMGMAPTQVEQGQQMMLGNARLHFYRNDEFGDSEATQNHASMLTHVQFGQRSLLLTADISNHSQRVLVKEGRWPLQADILKSPHHGFNHVEAAFLEAVAPVLAVITNAPGYAPAMEKQMAARQLPFFTMGGGNVHLLTDGHTWYAWQQKTGAPAPWEP